MLKLVPFNTNWVQNDKIDIKGIYRRPAFKDNEYGESERALGADGLPTWNLTGPLPIKQHNHWLAKGFEYVTLANREALIVASRTGTLPPGTTFKDFDQHQTGGPWNYRKYKEGQEVLASDELSELKAMIERFGVDAVEAIRRQKDPGFKVPDSLRPKSEPAKPKKETAA